MTKLPPCGLYRTTQAIDDQVPANALVYFHNHGDPGPGVYLPRTWKNNRVKFSERGTTIPDSEYAQSLQPLLPEGLYRVTEPFHCCEKKCQHFEQEMLVQLGYDGDGSAILFIPQMVSGAIALPSEGTLIDETQLTKISALKVVMDDTNDALVPNTTIH